MSRVWRLNGEDLNVTNVQTYPTHANVQRTKRLTRRQTQNNGREGGEFLENRGWELPTVRIRFNFQGRGQEKTDELDFVLNELETNDVITLESPDHLPIHVYLDHPRMPLDLTDWTNNPENSQAIQEIVLTAKVAGLWIADGGSFCETIHGSFKKLDNDPTYEREDGSTQDDLTIVLDDQATDYPTAKNPSTLQHDTLTPARTDTRRKRDGTGVVTETHDLTGYLFPDDPSNVGDIGAFEVCQAPSFATFPEDVKLAQSDLVADTDLVAAAIKDQPLSAVLDSTTAIAATLVQIRVISTSMTATTDVSGDMVLTPVAASTLASQTSATGVLLQVHASSSTLTATTTLTAALNLVQPLATALTADTSLTAATLLQHVISSSVVTNTTLTALAEVFTPLSTTITSTTDLVGALLQTHASQATLQTTSSITSNGVVIRDILATVASDTSITADAALIHVIASTLAAQSTVQALAEVFTPLSSTLTSQTSMQGSPGFVLDVTGTTTATTSLSGAGLLLKDMTVDGFERGGLTAYSGDTS